MNPLINRRVRITSVTIVVLIIMALMSAPASVLSLVVGGDGHPLLPAPPDFQLAQGEARDAATHYATPGRVDPLDARLETGSMSARESVAHHGDDLPGDVLIDDPSLQRTQSPGSVDDGGSLGGFDFPQDGHLPLVAANNGASGFPRGGLRFLGAGGFGGAGGGSGAAGGSGSGAASGSGSGAASGSGSAASGGDSGAANGGTGAEASNDGGSTRDPESIDSSSDGSSGDSEGSRGTTPDAGEPGTREDGRPGIEPLPNEDGKNVDPGLKDPEVPSPGGDGSGPETPSIGGPGGPVEPVSVPEPSSLLLTGLGLVALVARHRRASRGVRQADQA